MKPLQLLAFAWRTLRRELRYGELSTLATALVLAVAALGAVATLGLRVERALVGGAAELMGGDLGVSARDAIPAEFATEARRLGLDDCASAEFPSVLFAGERSRLAQVRATEAACPLRGELRVRDANGAERIAHAPAAGEAYADPALLADLGLKPGDTLALGESTLRIAAVLLREPDGGQLVSLAPRLLIPLGDARAAGLLGAGSRANWKLMVAGDPAALGAFEGWARPRLPDRARLTTLARSQRTLASALERGESFLRLAALLAALLSGIAVALAAQRYARRKTDEVALLRCLGASRGEVFAAPVLTLTLLALPACAIGALLGFGLQAAVFALASDLLPGAAPGVPIGPMAAAFGMGLAVLYGFALPPLLRLRDVPPVRVFQRAMVPQVRGFDLLYLLPIALSAALIWLQSGGAPALAGVLGASLVIVAAVSLALGYGLLAAVGRAATRLSGAVRFGVANLARRRRLTLVQIAALALALTGLDLLAIVGPSLLSAWRAELPADTPNYFIVNLQPDQRDAVAAKLGTLQATRLNMLPLAAGKLVAVNDQPPLANADRDDEGGGGGRDGGETRLSWTDAVPESNELVAGRWFPAEPTEPELSLDEGWMKWQRIALGDRLTLKVGEREITARVTSARKIDWSSFRVNFFVLLDPVSARDLPHSYLASVHVPPARAAELGALARELPNLSLIDLRALIDRVRDITDRVGRAVSWVLGFSLAAGLLVLSAALAVTSDERRGEAALLRTLGARRRQLDAAVLGEFALLGLLAGAVAAIGAGGGGTWLARAVFHIDYLPPFGGLALASAAAATLVALAGWLGTRSVSRASPLLVLRKSG